MKLYAIEDLHNELEETLRVLGNRLSRDGQIQAGREISTPVFRVATQDEVYERWFNSMVSSYRATKELLEQVRGI